MTTQTQITLRQRHNTSAAFFPSSLANDRHDVRMVQERHGVEFGEKSLLVAFVDHLHGHAFSVVLARVDLAKASAR